MGRIPRPWTRSGGTTQSFSSRMAVSFVVDKESHLWHSFHATVSFGAAVLPHTIWVLPQSAIYFGPDVQNQVIPLFITVRPGAIFPGHVGKRQPVWRTLKPVESKHRIFRSRAVTRPIVLTMAIQNVAHLSQQERQTVPVYTRSRARMGQTIETRVLERFAPAMSFATREGDIVYFSSRPEISRASRRRTNTAILAIARKGVGYDLRMV